MTITRRDLFRRLGVLPVAGAAVAALGMAKHPKGDETGAHGGGVDMYEDGTSTPLAQMTFADGARETIWIGSDGHIYRWDGQTLSGL